MGKSNTIQFIIAITISILIAIGCSSGGSDKKQDETNPDSSGTTPPVVQEQGTAPVITSASITPVNDASVKSTGKNIIWKISFSATDPDLDMTKLNYAISATLSSVHIHADALAVLPEQTTINMTYTDVCEATLDNLDEFEHSGTIELEIELIAEDKEGNRSAVYTFNYTYALEINSPPDAVDDTATTEMNTDITIDVLSNDTDIDGDALSVSAISGQTNATFTDSSDGTVTVIPETNFTGEASCQYTITDGNEETDTATVTITVTEPPNNPPVAVDDTETTEMNVDVTVDVITNDSDVDSDDLSVSEISNQTNGTFVDNGDGTITVIPETNFTGEASCDYTVTDGTDTDTGTLTITVTEPPNNPPVAVDDSSSTNQDTTTSVDVISNDTDDDGDTLSIDEISNQVGGIFSKNGTDRITFYPSSGFYGTATCDYTVTDGTDTDTGKLTITVYQVVVTPPSDPTPPPNEGGGIGTFD